MAYIKSVRLITSSKSALVITKRIICVGYLLWSTRLAMSGCVSVGLAPKIGALKRKRALRGETSHKSLSVNELRGRAPPLAVTP